jgi:hypothetical protein
MQIAMTAAHKASCGTLVKQAPDISRCSVSFLNLLPISATWNLACR